MTELKSLKNGTTLIFEDVPNSETISIGVYVKTGTANEGDYPEGIAHFMEHMLFKGSKQYSRQQLSTEFDKIGGYNNAYTTKLYTCYFCKTLKRFEKKATDLLLDMVKNPLFIEEEITREKKVILEEIKMIEDTPEEWLLDKLENEIYKDQPLGRMILGTPQSVNEIDRKTLVDFHEKFYQSNRLIVSVAGAYSESLKEEIIERLTDEQSIAIDEDQQKMQFIEKKETYYKNELEQTHFMRSYVAPSYNDEHYYSTNILNTILGETMSSKLFQVLREEHGLCYNVYSDFQSFPNDGLLTIYVATDKENVDASSKLITEVLENLLKDGITQEELDDAKSHIITSFLMASESNQNKMTRNARSIMFHNELISNDKFEKEINQIQLKDIKTATKILLEASYSEFILTEK
ncbi:MULTISPECIES: M16 family metallopeptidase [Mammaliicoccus]|uniref:M16 family metallopeptidase n=1 Tax=Mammaliicoccus TaxID=2803850 RepID=UPI000E0253C8|nr:MULTISPECIES: pitrilysin family protein [Mammaliicoccus]MEB7805556.1 insulinase family protein [Mammaliicoccus fleurettii]RTX91114.1 insulinase family protein [Mammaliicoccus fleurettii]SUM36856.1 peptidase, M16 family [Mammaliicoccus fleurettii]HCN59586.1 insulinase family protein [Staphylococcus sp.]